MQEYKTALVTGAQNAVGAAIAKAPIEQKINMTINYLNESVVFSLVRLTKEKEVQTSS